MRTVFLIAMALAGLWGSTAVAGGPQYALGVDGLACPFCAYGIEKRLDQIDGVVDIQTDVSEGRVVVSLEEGASLAEEQAREAVDEAGFTLRSFEQLSPEDAP